MDTNKTQDILTKIKGLIANAENYREQGKEEVATLYAEKAQELLSKYKLDLTDIERLQEEEANPFTYELVEPELWGDKEQNCRVEVTENLAATIAEAFYCRVLVLMENNKLILVGRVSDIAITKYMLSVVIRSALAACEVELAQITTNPDFDALTWKFSGGNEEFRFSFLSGYNTRIAYRLREKMKKIEVETSNALILRDANKQVEDYLETLNPNKIDEQKTRFSMMSRAYYTGADYGEKINLNPNGLGNTNQKQIGD